MADKGNKKEELTVVSLEPVSGVDDGTKDTNASILDSKDKAAKEISTELSTSKDETKEPKTESEKEKPQKTETEKQESTEETKDTKKVEESGESTPPPPPPRPVSPTTRVTNDLQEAFPNVEKKYITALLIASRGNPDAAFNGLLYLSDPSTKADIQISSSEPLPLRITNNASIADDELLARKLQKEFEVEERRRRRRNQPQDRNRNRDRREEIEDDSPDEFGQLKESFTQGVEEARNTLNGWVSGIAKKFDSRGKAENQDPKLFGALGGSSFNENRRRNERFDEDPEIIPNDFHNKISLTNNDNEQAPKLPSRNAEQPTKTAIGQNATNEKKWQPLSSDTPVNSDAFLVTDSEDEEESNKKTSVL